VVKIVGLKKGRVVASIDLPETKVCGSTSEMRIETSESHPITVKGLFLAAAGSVPTMSGSERFVGEFGELTDQLFKSMPYLREVAVL
jgi:hypothetical protein